MFLLLNNFSRFPFRIVKNWNGLSSARVCRLNLRSLFAAAPKNKFFRCCCTTTTVNMNGEPEVKRANVGTVKIGTHSGCFHCDEALACFMLRQLPEYKHADIVRTRDLEVLDTLDIIVDVGGIYDPSKQRYDHHQREFNGTMSSLCPGKKWTTKLSSAGLIYLHFGLRVLAQAIDAKPDDKIVSILYDKVYENFIEEVDAIDNGVPICDEKPRYHISTLLSSRVGRLNPTWNEKDADSDELFKKAMALVGSEFLERVRFYADSWWPARELVRNAIEERFQVDPSGEIIEFGGSGYPWKDHLFEMEDQLKIEPTIKFVLYTDPGGKWRVQGVPIFADSFMLRVPLLEEWRGLRDKRLEEVSGIAGTTFVHSSGFTGGNNFRDGALKMAKLTLAKHAASTE